MFGWAGRILRVDLTKGEIVRQPLDEDYAKSFLGGLGFSLKIMFDEFEPEQVKDPLDPANIICLTPGTLGGTPVGGASRLNVSVARSPTLRTTGDGSAGGRFANELKWANYDGIVIKGKAPDLVYLWIKDDHVEIRDARHLRGKGVYDTNRLIKEELHDSEVETVVIGPSGENMVLGAIPVVSATRVPASGSSGTVFGSKNLKAIAVRGTKGIKVARPEELLRAAQEVYQTGIKAPTFSLWSQRGTKWLIEVSAPISRRYGVHWERPYPLEKMHWREFTEKYQIPDRFKACDGCFVHCDAMWRIKEGPHAGLMGRGLNHGVMRYFGYVPGITNYGDVLYLSHLSTDLGLESTIAGEVIGAALQLWEEGVLSAKDTGGLKLEWGNTSLVAELLQQIAHRKGFGGAWLSEGSSGFVAKLADRGIPREKGEEYFLENKKGRDVLLDTREKGVGGALSLGMETRSTEVATMGAHQGRQPDMAALRHLGVPEEVANEFIKRSTNDPATPRGKGYGKVFYDNLSMVSNCLGICKRHTGWEAMSLGVELMAKCFAAATGVDYDWEDMFKCAERVWNVDQALDVRYGLRRDDDILPDWWFDRPRETAPGKGATLNRAEYEEALDDFYRERGWDRNSIPTREKLEELGLQDVAAKLEQSGILAARGASGSGKKAGGSKR